MTPQLFSPSPRPIARVLIELDEPELVVRRDNEGHEFLSLRLEGRGGQESWFDATLSPLEQAALVTGTASTRSVLEKDDALVVDRAEGQPDRAFSVGDRDVDALLPAPTIRLPDHVRSAWRLELPEPPLAEMLFSDSANSHEITFDALTDLVGAFQDFQRGVVADRVDQRVRRVGPDPRGVLSVVATTQGSFGLRVRAADSKAFGDSVSFLADTVDRAERSALHVLEFLRSRHDLRGRLDRVLRASDSNGVSMLVRASGRAAFLSPSVARRVLARIRPATRRDEEEIVRGELAGWSSIRSTFQLRNADMTYDGNVAIEALKNLVPLVIGNEYIARLRVSRTDKAGATEKASYELVEIRATGDIPES